MATLSEIEEYYAKDHVDPFPDDETRLDVMQEARFFVVKNGRHYWTEGLGMWSDRQGFNESMSRPGNSTMMFELDEAISLAKRMKAKICATSIFGD
jgi:hypothetical protein